MEITIKLNSDLVQRAHDLWDKVAPKSEPMNITETLEALAIIKAIMKKTPRE